MSARRFDRAMMRDLIPSPRVWRLSRPIAFALVATALGQCAIDARSQEAAPPPDERSVTWYADNPAARNAVLAWCREHPRQAMDVPDCAAAWDSQMVEVLREGEAFLGARPRAIVPPTPPAQQPRRRRPQRYRT